MLDPILRLRFAPSPTGMMHLGNVRSALINYLFAKKYHGTLILRIEDTDAERNCDPGAEKILSDLEWLNIEFQEGPAKGGPYAPYFQSMRNAIYQQKLEELIKNGIVYRCFCTAELLEKKRKQQQSIKLPPRYDRTCRTLSNELVASYLEKQTPFIWRLKVEMAGTVTIGDLARGSVVFELGNFSDFPLTRQDHSFTFMFANCVDDIVMQISHVIRGEDHLTNTVGQAMLYRAFNAPLPIFWHLPIITNASGQKLSKRDFGFSLDDLQKGGFIPEAICNYLATIGRGTLTKEILPIADIALQFSTNTINSTGHIRYDVDKLRWFNQQWIAQLEIVDLSQRCTPFLHKAGIIFPDTKEQVRCLKIIQPALVTLADSAMLLAFYKAIPSGDIATPLDRYATEKGELFAQVKNVIAQKVGSLTQENMVSALKAEGIVHGIPTKELFTFVRLALTGKPEGLSVHEIVEVLGFVETQRRLLEATQSA